MVEWPAVPPGISIRLVCLGFERVHLLRLRQIVFVGFLVELCALFAGFGVHHTGAVTARYWHTASRRPVGTHPVLALHNSPSGFLAGAAGWPVCRIENATPRRSVIRLARWYHHQVRLPF